MGFFRRMAGFLGFTKDDVSDPQHVRQDEAREDHHYQQGPSGSDFLETGLPRRGFSVPVQVSVERPHLVPVLAPSTSGDGGVQGLRWHAKRLKVDEDGDVADEFFYEVLPETSSIAVDQHKPLPRFEVKNSTRAAKIRNQVITHDGKIQHGVEYQGRLQWI